MSLTCWDAGRVYYLIWGVKVVTKATTAQNDSRSKAVRRGLPMLLFLFTSCLFTGCMALPWGNTAKKLEEPKGPVDSMVLRGGGLEKDNGHIDPTLQAELDSGKRLFQDKEFDKAEAVFAKLAKNMKNPVPVLDDAMYYQAACQFYRSDFRKAEGGLKKYIKEFRYGAHADEANRRLFDIANYWLDDTRKNMAGYEEKREGKRLFVLPSSYISFSKERPFLDTEGHALQCLEEVRLNDIGGPLGEKSLFYIATVKFFHEDYKDADYYYAQLYENYPNSVLAPKAIKQAIICKQLVTGGSCYDTRPVEESRKLIHTATTAYPQLNKDQEWIARQLVSVNLQQADRDYNIAEFYRRTGHPGSAYFYFELVRRRYPNTEYAEKAVARMNTLRDKVVREQGTEGAEQRYPAGQALQRLFSPSSSANNNPPANNPAGPQPAGAPSSPPRSLPGSVTQGQQ